MTFTRTRIAWAVGLLLLLAIVTAVLLLPRVLDEERVRAEAERRLTEALGRPVTIGGKVSLDAGTTTRVDASDVTIGGGVAGAPPLLVLGRIQASIETASLLGGAPELGAVRLEAPRLHLHVDRDGRANWSGLGPAPTGDTAPQAGTASGRGTPPKDGGASAAPAWSIASLTIERGELRYTDARSGADFTLQDWHLEAGRVSLPEPFDVATRFEARRAEGTLGRVEFRARVTADAARSQYVLEDVAVDARLARAAGPLPLTLAAERLDYAGATGTAGLRGLRATAAGLALRADGTASELATAPVVDATIVTEPFSPRESMNALGVTAPPMAGPAALERAQVSVRVHVADGVARLSALDARLDDTRLAGTGSVTVAAPRRWTFDLAADRVLADRYAKPAALRDDSPVVLPLEFVRGLDVAGTLRVGELVVAGVTLRDLSIDLGEEARRAPMTEARP
jgi:AsmA protein